ncbi:MAG: hypothetical protein SH850_24795 [Planctomycetaceae bacterium]|nr:hypothetical protein [Planctomycetaceae bacterium]
MMDGRPGFDLVEQHRHRQLDAVVGDRHADVLRRRVAEVRHADLDPQRHSRRRDLHRGRQLGHRQIRLRRRHRLHKIDRHAGRGEFVDDAGDRLLVLPVGFTEIGDDVQLLHGPLLLLQEFERRPQPGDEVQTLVRTLERLRLQFGRHLQHKRFIHIPLRDERLLGPRQPHQRERLRVRPLGTFREQLVDDS